MRVLAVAALAVAALAGGAAAVTPTDKQGTLPVTDLSFFQDKTDAQLADLFKTYGYAMMPGQEPLYNNAQAGKPWYDFCVGRTVINAATTAASNTIAGVWPQGPAHPLNNLFMRGWWGKVFYNDGTDPDIVQMWNLLYSNGTVDFNAIAFIGDSDRTTKDQRQSMFVDYAATDFAPFRTVIDEVRLVNTAENIYLGRIWASNPIESLVKPGYKNRVDEVLYKGKLAALNSTWLDFVGWSGLATLDAATGLPEEYFTLGWFCMKCIGPSAPKLKYAWTAYFVTFINLLTGFARPEATLPGIPYAPSDNPTRVGPGFPSPSYGSGTVFPKLHIWPFKVSDVAPAQGGQLANVSQIPPFKGEPVLGEAKLYPIVTEGINNWFDEGRPDPSWTPSELELKAADIAKWVNGPFAKLTAQHYATNGSVSNLTLPADHVNPTWNAAMAAIHAVEAANAAAKHAAENPTDPVNKVAKLLKTKEYAARVIVHFPQGFVGTTVEGALANKPPTYNLTGFMDYMEGMKHQPFVHLPKLNYTPPEIVWEGSLKHALANMTGKPWDIKLGGKNLTAWKEDLVDVLTKDDDTAYKHELEAVRGHALKGRKMV